MTIPHYINEHQSDIRAIKPGWYGVENNGKLSSGPYPNHGECLTGIHSGERQFSSISVVGAGHREERFSSIALVADHQVSQVRRRAHPAVHAVR
jgi:hypothetical protein